METTIRLTSKDVGCFIDGSTQSADYINRQTVSLANENGGKIEMPKKGDDYSEMLSYAGDEALDYLNTLCDDSVCFTFEDNSLFLVSTEEENN